MTYLYLVLVSSALTSNVVYTKTGNREKLVTYDLQSTKLSRVSESLPISVAAALGIMKPEPPIIVLVDF